MKKFILTLLMGFVMFSFNACTIIPIPIIIPAKKSECKVKGTSKA